MEDVKLNAGTKEQPKKKSGFRKFLRWFVFIVLVSAAISFWWKYYFVFGEGVKSGELNYVVKKGNVFKTYEGNLIQSGIRSRTAGSIESYEFKFSVEDQAVADSLMHCSGKQLELHYKEYLKPLPWRGVSEYVVDGIISVKE